MHKHWAASPPAFVSPFSRAWRNSMEEGSCFLSAEEAAERRRLQRCISGRPPSYAAPSEAISAKCAFITKNHMCPVTCANLQTNNKQRTTTHNGDPRPSHSRVARTRLARRSRLLYRYRDPKIPSKSSLAVEEYCGMQSVCFCFCCLAAAAAMLAAPVAAT